MIEVELPDGSIVEFPDGTPDDVINGALQQYAAQPAPAPAPQAPAVDPWDQRGANGVPGGEFAPSPPPAAPVSAMGYAEDILKSGASGVARGAADLAGLPGTISNAVNSGLSWATGLPQLPQSAMSGQSLRDSAAYATDGATNYEAQTTPGQYAGTIGEFLPGAVAFGGASPAALAANAVAPAVGSEAAGQMTEGTFLEPYARVAGALVGGSAGNFARNFAGGRGAAVPTAREIKDSAGYAELAPVMKEAKIGKDTWNGIIKELRDDAADFGMTTQQRGEFNGVLNDFAKRGAKEGGSMYDLEVLRRSLANAGQDVTKPANQALSGRLVDKLDEAVDAIPGGSGQAAADGSTVDDTIAALGLARETWRTGRKAELVENAIRLAQGQKSGVENGMRIQFGKLLDDPKKGKMFSDIERQAMEDVRKGNFTRNALRFIGTMGVPIDQARSFLGPLSGAMAGGSMGGGMTLGGIASGIALPAVGTAAKYGASKATQNAASVAEALVKAGPQGAAAYGQAVQAADQSTRAALLRTLLQGSGAYEAGQR